MAVARPASFALFVFVAISYGALTAAYVGSDFSVMNVVQNSHSAEAARIQDLGRLGEP